VGRCGVWRKERRKCQSLYCDFNASEIYEIHVMRFCLVFLVTTGFLPRRRVRLLGRRHGRCVYWADGTQGVFIGQTARKVCLLGRRHGRKVT